MSFNLPQLNFKARAFTDHSLPSPTTTNQVDLYTAHAAQLPAWLLLRHKLSGLSTGVRAVETMMAHYFYLLMYSNIWGNVSIYFLRTIYYNYLFIYVMACDVIYIVIYNKVYLWYQELEWKWFYDWNWSWCHWITDTFFLYYKCLYQLITIRKMQIFSSLFLNFRRTFCRFFGDVVMICTSWWPILASVREPQIRRKGHYITNHASVPDCGVQLYWSQGEDS